MHNQDPWRWPHFSRAEMQCKCGCGRADMDPDFMDLLEDLRTRFNKPLVVTSAYRCPKHNSAVSSTGEKGPHTTGKAVDINVHGADAVRLVKLWLSMGLTRFGMNQKGALSGRFVHLDTLKVADGFPEITTWTY